MTRFLLLPLKPAPLMLVALFSVLLWILTLAGLIGAAVAVIPVSWFFKYCFVTLDAVIAGDEEPPVLSIEMVNPFTEQRPLAALCLIAAGCALVRLAWKAAGEPGLVVSGAALLAALPASLAVLALGSNPLQAASPVALVRLIRGLGQHYAWLVLSTLLIGAGTYTLVQQRSPLGLALPLGQLGFLYLFTLIGGTVHVNRVALGITTRSRQERLAEREERELSLARKRMLDSSFTHLRLGRAAEAWREIERWIETHGRGDGADAEYAAILDSTLRWEPPAVGDRLASEYLSRLLARRENGRALEVLEQRLASNPRFRPEPPDHARRLEELAALAGKRALRRQLRTDEQPQTDLPSESR